MPIPMPNCALAGKLVVFANAGSMEIGWSLEITSQAPPFCKHIIFAALNLFGKMPLLKYRLDIFVYTDLSSIQNSLQILLSKTSKRMVERL